MSGSQKTQTQVEVGEARGKKTRANAIAGKGQAASGRTELKRQEKEIGGGYQKEA